MEFMDEVKADVVFKRHLGRSSTSVKKQYFEEREAPASHAPVYPGLQLYSQFGAVTPDVPTDILGLGGSITDVDDVGAPVAGSYVGRTSAVNPVLRKYVSVPLVALPTPQGKAFVAPKCVACAAHPGFAAGETLSGATSGARAVVVAVQGANVFYRVGCGVALDFVAGETLRGLVSGASAAVVQDSNTCPLSRVLRAVVPYDHGNGGYNQALFKADGTRIFFGEGNWLLDTFSGVLTFYGCLPSGVSATAPPSITFYRYVGGIGLNFSNAANGNVGLGTDAPLVSLDLRTTDALRVPTGTTAERPAPPQEGYLRFNSDLDCFEGYDGVLWSDLQKGTGNGSDPVNIATGGMDRLVTIGNATGASGVQVLAGTGNISLRNSGDVTLDAASGVSISTRGPGPSTIDIGSGVDNLSINLIATGTNSSINLLGNVSIAGITDLHSNATSLKIVGTLSAGQDGVWVINLEPDIGGTSTNLVFQKMVSGTYVTRFVMS